MSTRKDSSVFLIQGVFFFAYPGLPTEWYRFGGIILPDEKHVMKPLIGGLHDFFGNSTLSDIHITPFEISFIKKYNGRNDEIKYVFTLLSEETGIWEGSYDGKATGSHKARCTLLRTTLAFLNPQPM